MNLTGVGTLITDDSISFLDIKYATLGANNEIEISGNMMCVLGKRPFRKEVDRVVSNPGIKKVIFNDPVTVVIWDDDTKTMVKCQPGDTYDAEKGLALCIAKKYFGNKGNFNEVFKKWIPREDISVEEMRDELDEFCDRGTPCRECVLDGETCRCGYSAHFKSKNKLGKYTMSDNEIRKAYRIVFSK